MHAELVVPALLPRGDALQFPRLPALELLLSRGRRKADARCSYEQWIATACGLGEEAPLPAGALTLLAEGSEPGNAVWMRADPVHLRLGRTDLRFVPAAAFDLGVEECARLAESLNRHFAGELEFFPVDPRHWCVRLATVPRITALATAEVAGRDVDANLPQGEDAKLWHARLNEVQMLLHRDPVNQAREARGAPEVNSVWFWGAGRVPPPSADSAAHCAAHSADFRWRSVSADEPVARGLALRLQRRAQRLPDSAEAWLAQLPDEGRHLAVLDAQRVPLALDAAAEWHERLVVLEAKWFAPLLDALRIGRIGMLTLHAPDGREALACETVRGDLRRFWRRQRPLSAFA
jgi:hypothetical protein